jgi:hypothetical protein
MSKICTPNFRTKDDRIFSPPFFLWLSPTTLFTEMTCIFLCTRGQCPLASKSFGMVRHSFDRQKHCTWLCHACYEPRCAKPLGGVRVEIQRPQTELGLGLQCLCMTADSNLTWRMGVLELILSISFGGNLFSFCRLFKWYNLVRIECNDCSKLIWHTYLHRYF